VRTCHWPGYPSHVSLASCMPPPSPRYSEFRSDSTCRRFE
jgi:hypothetical protein